MCRKLTIPCKKPQTIAGVKDLWEESRENIELGEIIGHGNFGEVYKGCKFIIQTQSKIIIKLFISRHLAKKV